MNNNNDIQITGKHDHVPNPTKIEMKQSGGYLNQEIPLVLQYKKYR